MYCCPACGADDVANQSVCRCGADLALLQQLEVLADVWFNRALEALKNGAPGAALEWLSACCAARPTDAPARRAQARVWAQLGRLPEACAALDRAAEIEPDAPEVEEIRQALRSALLPDAASTPKGSPAPADTVSSRDKRTALRRTEQQKKAKTKASKRARRPRR